MMDSYYVELARSAVAKANDNLRNAEQYLSRAGEADAMIDGISRTISGLENRNKLMGYWLKEGIATPK